MVKVSYVNSAHCKIVTCVLKRMKYILSAHFNHILRKLKV